MRSRSQIFGFLGAVAMSTAAACGGAPAQPSVPASEPPPPAAPAAQPEPSAPGAKPEPDTFADDEPGLDESEPLLGGVRLGEDPDALFDQFRAFEAELLQAGHACSRACQALRSMQRASQRLCELAESAEEEHRCHDAQRRYREARDRVRVSCRICPQGPALDGDADAR